MSPGDFNDDDFDDLAIGVSRESVAAIAAAGAANLLHGSPSGLTAAGDQSWHQDVPGVQGAAEANDLFGSTLASGDFNNDDFDDLAIGVPGEAIGSLAAGAVNLLRGSSAGLTAAGDQVWHQDVAGVSGGAESGDRFGGALAVGDFDGDGNDDLAVGVDGEDIAGAADAGAVTVLFGSVSGLTSAGDQLWHQDVAGIDGAAESGDRFGDALAVGDFDGDDFDDLAIGAPSEDVSGRADAGAVNVVFGSVSGLSASGDQSRHQDVAGIGGAAETGDGFGDALAVGDFNADGFDDLAIGVSGEDVGGVTDAGAVNVLYGSAGGLSASGDQVWHQEVAAVAGASEDFDFFGAALHVGDFDDDGFDDLAIGVPGEDIGNTADAGAATVLYGSSGGLTATDSQSWHQDIAGVIGAAEPNDMFGGALG